MKLTDQHVSDKMLNLLIAMEDLKNGPSQKDFMSILLELKQRRAEDRQREADQCAKH